MYTCSTVYKLLTVDLSVIWATHNIQFNYMWNENPLTLSLTSPNFVFSLYNFYSYLVLLLELGHLLTLLLAFPVHTK